MRKAEKLDRCAIFFVRLEKYLNDSLAVYMRTIV